MMIIMDKAILMMMMMMMMKMIMNVQNRCLKRCLGTLMMMMGMMVMIMLIEMMMMMRMMMMTIMMRIMMIMIIITTMMMISKELNRSCRSIEIVSYSPVVTVTLSSRNIVLLVIVAPRREVGIVEEGMATIMLILSPAETFDVRARRLPLLERRQGRKFLEPF